MELASLIVFVAVIVLAFLLKVNTGLLAIAAALVLAQLNGITEKELFGMFDSKMFLMLLGVMYIFCIAQENGTLERLAKKILRLCAGKPKLFPPILFVLSAGLSAVGPGLISVTALMASLVVALGKQTNIHPLKLMPFATLGSFAGGLSPLTPSGVVAISKAEEAGIQGLALPLSIYMALTCLLFSAILYFFVFKCHKFQNVPVRQEINESFTWKQWLTLAGILATALVTGITGINVGLVGITVSVVLTVAGVANESAALKKMPWGTVLLITGVGMLIEVVNEVGGIDLMARSLKSLMNRYTANPIVTVLAGVTSWFSSASGVVMPTYIPQVPTFVEGLAGVSQVGMTVGLCVGAHMAALSPLSSCGGLMLAAYSSSEGVEKKDTDKMFGRLFLMSAAGVLFAALLALIGVYH